jgi:hypothetical protein
LKNYYNKPKGGYTMKKASKKEKIVAGLLILIVGLIIMAAPSFGADKSHKIDSSRLEMFFGEHHPLQELSDVNDNSEAVLLLEGVLNYQYATEPPMDETLKLLTGCGLTKDNAFYAEFAKNFGE